jgi:hypothetical protein
MVVLCSNRHSAAVFSIQRSKHQDTEGHRGTEIEPKRRPTERRLQTVIALKLTPFWDDLGCGGIPREGGQDRLIGSSGDSMKGEVKRKFSPTTGGG